MYSAYLFKKESRTFGCITSFLLRTNFSKRNYFVTDFFRYCIIFALLNSKKCILKELNPPSRSLIGVDFTDPGQMLFIEARTPLFFKL